MKVGRRMVDRFWKQPERSRPKRASRWWVHKLGGFLQISGCSVHFCPFGQAGSDVSESRCAFVCIFFLKLTNLSLYPTKWQAL